MASPKDEAKTTPSQGPVPRGASGARSARKPPSKKKASIAVSQLDDSDAVVAKKPPPAKKKTRTRKPRPHDMPRRPLSAYNFFFRSERTRWLSERDEQGKGEKLQGVELFSAMGKEIARRWKQLGPEEEAMYQKMAADDLARYRREMEAYTAQPAHNLTLETGAQSQPTLESVLPANASGYNVRQTIAAMAQQQQQQSASGYKSELADRESSFDILGGSESYYSNFEQQLQRQHQQQLAHLQSMQIPGLGFSVSGTGEASLFDQNSLQLALLNRMQQEQQQALQLRALLAASTTSTNPVQEEFLRMQAAAASLGGMAPVQQDPFHAMLMARAASQRMSSAAPGGLADVAGQATSGSYLQEGARLQSESSRQAGNQQDEILLQLLQQQRDLQEQQSRNQRGR